MIEIPSPGEPAGGDWKNRENRMTGLGGEGGGGQKESREKIPRGRHGGLGGHQAERGKVLVVELQIRKSENKNKRNSLLAYERGVRKAGGGRQFSRTMWGKAIKKKNSSQADEIESPARRSVLQTKE